MKAPDSFCLFFFTRIKIEREREREKEPDAVCNAILDGDFSFEWRDDVGRSSS